MPRTSSALLSRARQVVRRAVRRNVSARRIQRRWRNLSPQIRDHRYMMRVAEPTARGTRYRTRIGGLTAQQASEVADYRQSALTEAARIRRRIILRNQRIARARHRVGRSMMYQIVRQRPRLNRDIAEKTSEYL